MNTFSSRRRKIYISLTIAAAITLVVCLIIWQQYGQPWSDSAAQITAPPVSTPTPTPNLTLTHIGYTGQEGQTALQILQQLYPSTITQGDGVNQVVVTIEGRPTSQESKLWVFYINSQLAPVGPASYQTQPTDQIDWYLEDF